MRALRPGPPRPGPGARYAGVFALSAATLMDEILLTRIFSVTLWYHFAFLAVAAALLGLSAGAVLVQVGVGATPGGPPRQGGWTLGFALGVPATFLAHLALPVVPTLTPHGLGSVLLTCILVALPFLASGVALCLALTRAPGPVAPVYAADLAGAAAGCLGAVAILQVVDAPAAVFGVGALGGLAAAAFALAEGRRGLAAAGLGLAAVGMGLAATAPAWLHVTWVKGGVERGPTLYERWNSYSRIRVSGDPASPAAPFGWGLSPAAPDRPVPQLLLSIDAVADTVLTRFTGDLGAVDHLRYDVTQFAHHLRPEARVLVVGAGGGRDVLAALAFGQPEVVAVEVNGAILEAVNGRFGEFTGHLDRHPAVRFVHDEARSWVARLDRRFDLIQVSFLDTFAAAAAGAYVLTEHALYTVEAWRTFLARLTPRGVLSYSRWYYHALPAEIHRLVALGSAALQASGVARPREHLLLIRSRRGADPRYPESVGVGTLLVARRPFAPADLARARDVAGRLGFEIVLDRDGSPDPTLLGLTDPAAFARTVAAAPLDISPPTDDRPFFFHTVPLRRALRGTLLEQGNVGFNTTAVVVLVGAVAVVAALTAACTAVPLARPRQRRAVRPGQAVFFAAIGLGYVLVEIAQLHRLAVFLGHPTHGLVVVLFTLLLASGLGSALLGRVPPDADPRAAVRPLWAVPGLLALLGALTPALTEALRALDTPLRVAAALLLLAPMGLVMGMPLPRGLELARRTAPRSGAWLWAINGAASVLGSVGGVLASIAAGLSTAFWLGVAAYVVAALAARRLGRPEPAGPPCGAPRPAPPSGPCR